jgi:hypothetical protein
MLDYEALEDLVDTFVGRATEQGWSRLWERKSDVLVQAPYVAMHVGEEQAIGEDEITRTLNGAGDAHIITVSGLREVMVLLTAYSLDQDGDNVARRQASRLRAALEHPVLREPFDTACVSIIEALPAVDLDAPIDDRLWNITQLPVRLHMTAELTIPGLTGGVIETIEYTGTVYEEDGTTVEESIPATTVSRS